jgi:hypothetical protein
MTSALLLESDGDARGSEEQAADAGATDARAPHESGIPPGGRYSDGHSYAAEADERVQFAIGESTRTEANLGFMLRGLQQLLNGVANASETNLSLVRQLDAARELLAHGHAERTALTRRVRMLEETLACARGDAERELSIFIEQEDAFLRELLADHASEAADLRRRLTSALENSARTASAVVEAPLADVTPEARETASEIGEVISDIEQAASESDEAAGQPESGAVIASVRLRAISVALPEASGERPSSKPPLKQKPDPSTRPLIGYSLGSGEVAAERIQSERRSSRTSRINK